MQHRPSVINFAGPSCLVPAPTRQLPDGLVRGLAFINPQLREVIPQLGIMRHASNAKAKRELDWSPRSTAETITATGKSLVRLGLLKTR